MPRWRLRSGLVQSAVLIVLLFLAVTGVLWEGLAHREAHTLVAKMQALGCWRGQGFLYARPMPIDQLNLSRSDSAEYAA